MSNFSQIPTLRFTEFHEHWKIKKTKEIAPLQRGFDLPTSNVIDGEYPVVYSNGILRKHNECKVKSPGVVTGRSGTIGKVTYVNKDYWPHNTSLWVTDFCGNHPKFIYYFYLNFKLHRYNAGSTVPTLNRNDVHSIKKSIPELKEQQKIASFLSSVDKKLELLQDKKDLLEQYKKGVMQQIFSQQIKFKDDDGNDYPEWVEMQISNVFENIGGTSLEKYFDNNGSHNVISIGNYTKEGNYNDNGQRIVFNEKTKTKLLKKGDLVMVLNDKTKSGDIIGSSILIKENDKFIYNQRSERLICNTNLILPEYAWLYLNSRKFRKLVFSVSQGGTQIYVNFSEVRKLFLLIPSLEEQLKISTFLNGIIDKIRLINNQIDKTQNFKKGLLQKMFV